MLQRPIDVDPVTRRVFIMAVIYTNGGSKPSVAVIKDRSSMWSGDGPAGTTKRSTSPRSPVSLTASASADAGCTAWQVPHGWGTQQPDLQHIACRLARHLRHRTTRWSQIAVARGVPVGTPAPRLSRPGRTTRHLRRPGRSRAGGGCATSASRRARVTADSATATCRPRSAGAEASTSVPRTAMANPAVAHPGRAVCARPAASVDTPRPTAAGRS